MLEEVGYPFKSKQHSNCLALYQRKGLTESSLRYIGQHPEKDNWSTRFSCPKKLTYQFSEDFKLNVSDQCCVELKEKPLAKYSKESGRAICITGLMREEGGRRMNSVCLAFRGGKLKKFQPLVVASKAWEDWFIEAFKVQLCAMYYPPYSYIRTGCKGCPFAVNIQAELDLMEELLPAERKQCEMIWGPVYDEYRRIGYRLKKETTDDSQQRNHNINSDQSQGNSLEAGEAVLP